MRKGEGRSPVQLLNGSLDTGKGRLAAHHAGKVGAAAGGALLAGQGNAQRVEQPAVLFAQFFSLGLAGIKNGFQISRKNKKVRFSMRNLPRYIQLQFELWINIFRRFAG